MTQAIHFVEQGVLGDGECLQEFFRERGYKLEVKNLACQGIAYKNYRVFVPGSLSLVVYRMPESISGKKINYTQAMEHHREGVMVMYHLPFDGPFTVMWITNKDCWQDNYVAVYEDNTKLEVHIDAHGIKTTYVNGDQRSVNEHYWMESIQ